MVAARQKERVERSNALPYVRFKKEEKNKNNWNYFFFFNKSVDMKWHTDRENIVATQTDPLVKAIQGQIRNKRLQVMKKLSQYICPCSAERLKVVAQL